MTCIKRYRRFTGLAVAGMVFATGATLAADGDVPGAAVQKVVVRSTAQFDFDRDQVKPEDAQRILSELGAAGNVTWQSVNAVGYTDSVGTVAYNQGLSERRAAAIKAYLVTKGVTPDMIATTGRGPQEPIASNDEPDGRAQNRRTAIEFQGVKAGDR